jgi:hypothetical protein
LEKNRVSFELFNKEVRMGAWGAGSFENDDALDWLAEFCESPDEKRIMDALSLVANVDAAGYLEAPECSTGLAAAELVAALKGKPASNLPEEAKECLSTLKFSPKADLAPLALKTVDRIITNSELKELWEESGDPGEWYSALDDLRERLKS